MTVNIDPVKTIATLSCPPLLEGAISRREADRVAAALKVLAEPARLRLLSLIQAQPDGEACVCHLTQPLGLTQPTVSHHLKVLHEAGLVTREQRGVWAYYRADQARTSRGTGLGLAIVKHVVTSAGGTIEAFSPPGRGLEIVCRFPAS